MRGRAELLVSLLLLAAALAGGCLAPEEAPRFDAPTEPGGPGPDGAGDADGSGGAGGIGSDPSPPAAPPPVFDLVLQLAPFDDPGHLGVNATLSLASPLDVSRVLHLDWTLDAAPLDEALIDWAADGPAQVALQRAWVLEPGAYALNATAYWEGFEPAAAHAGLAVDVPDGVRLVLNASEAYTEDVAQQAFYSDWDIPFLPWEEESALAVLERAATMKGFPYNAPYHADLDAHYVKMVNGTEEVWVVQGFVSRSWMILLDEGLAGSAIDHVVPEPGQTIELRYVQCYASGQCDGTG